MNNKFNLNLANVPKELKLILELLKNDLNNMKEFNNNEVNWDQFIKQAIHHRIYPLLYSRLKKLNEEIVPKQVFQKLNYLYKKNTLNMLHLSAEMEMVNKLFNEDKIRLLFLKGPVIAQDLYGDISLRTSSDLDFLIPIEDLPRAEELLLKHGYIKDDYIETVLNDWKWRHHHVTYYHSKKRMKLEIHWRLNPGPGKEPSFNELWKRKSKCSFTKSPIFLLGKEDLFLFLVSHGARHGWSRLRWLMDINQLLERSEIKFDTVLYLLNKYHFLPAGIQATLLSNQLLNSRVPDEIRPLLTKQRYRGLAQEAIFYFENMVNLHTEPIPEKISKYHQRHLFSLMSSPQKVLFILSFLHPYPEDAETLPLPKQFHLLYFPLRPLLWAWRKSRRQVLP